MPVRDTIARAYAATDGVVEDIGDRLRDRVMQLLFDPDERNEALWIDALEDLDIDSEVAIELTPEDLDEVEQRDRGTDWIALQAALAAAASQQARLELVYRPLLRQAQRGADAIRRHAGKLTAGEKLIAAKEGVGKARFERAKEENKVARAAKAKEAAARREG